MLSKEEIENIKRGLTEELGRTITANECGLSTNDFSESIKILEGVLNYINQLESDKQNLIKKLEEESKQLDEETKQIAIELNKTRDIVITDEYEEAENEEYILILEEKYEKANIKRIRTNEILSIMKGEKE